MKIQKIGYLFGYTTSNNDICNKQQNIITAEGKNNNSFGYTSLPFMANLRVDKGMNRFYEFNKNRVPTTVKSFIKSYPEVFNLTPKEVQQKAFEKLEQAKDILDVQKLFPEEELFIYLESAKNTKAMNGLLGIYREFKEIYENGILKNGEDLTLYLVKKIFLEAKTMNEINEDLDKDLLSDIKNEFKRKYPNATYVHPSTLKALGIYSPDADYRNSLKFTREGYSDEFGLKISQAQTRYWNSLSDEQKFEILSKRCEGRDNWWNKLSHNEKLELAAGVDSDEDLFRNYKRFVRQSKKGIKEGETDIGLQKPLKKIRVGSAKLKDKEVFILWFKKNIEKFYSSLSEADKDSVHIKRVRKLAVRWQEMSPEEKTAMINKMREGREPSRFVMIDAWNHSRVLIRELSDYLKAQQILKPVDMLYSSEGFSEFQSKIMTEFWANHRDMAEEFGRNIKNSISRVEDAISRGQFEDLKQEIMRDRAYRIKLLKRDYYLEEMKAKEAKEAEKAKDAEIVLKEAKEQIEKNIDYKEDFKKSYGLSIDKHNVLPASYKEEMADIMIERFPKEIILKYTESLKNDQNKLPEELREYLVKEADKNDSPRTERIQRALEAAISNELVAKGGNPIFYQSMVDSLINLYERRINTPGLNKKQKPDKERVDKLYNEYKKDLTELELYDILHGYFVSGIDRDLKDSETQLIEDYIKSYGKTALILFSNKSAFPKEVKENILTKFSTLMPKKLKELVKIKFDINEESDIAKLSGQLKLQYDFVPSEAMDSYISELAASIRAYRGTNTDMEKSYNIKTIRENLLSKKDLNSGYSYLNMSKLNLLSGNKLRILAAEQAMADELYSVTKDPKVYSYELDRLIALFKMLLNVSKNSKNNKTDIYNEQKELVFSAVSCPKVSMLKSKYNEYISEIKTREDLFDENGKIDKEELLCVLNPDEEKVDVDENVRKRIQSYFDES